MHSYIHTPTHTPRLLVHANFRFVWGGGDIWNNVLVGAGTGMSADILIESRAVRAQVDLNVWWWWGKRREQEDGTGRCTLQNRTQLLTSDPLNCTYLPTYLHVVDVVNIWGNLDFAQICIFWCQNQQKKAIVFFNHTCIKTLSIAPKVANLPILFVSINKIISHI